MATSYDAGKQTYDTAGSDYDLTGGGTLWVDSGTGQQNIPALSITTPAGYTAQIKIGSGAYADVGPTYTFSDAISADTEVYVRFSQDPTYSLTYDVNGGNADGPAAVDGLAAQTGYALDSATIPTHAGDSGTDVVFIGWTAAQDSTIYAANDTAPATITTVDISGNTTVYAAWGYDENNNGTPDVLENKFSLTYDVNGGNADGPAAVNGLLAQTGYALDSATIPTHASVGGTDVVFIGWTAAQDGTIYAADDTAPATITTVDISGNTTVYAVWGYDENNNGTPDVLEGKAIITFKVVNGTWDDGTTADKTVEVTLINGKGTLASSSVPTGMTANSGYEGGTWNVTPNTAADGITANVTYTFSFTAIHSGGGGTAYYTLTFETNGGTSISPVSKEAGTTVSLDSYATTREGFHFEGWYADRELTQKVTEIKLDSNKTVYAKWLDGSASLEKEDHFAYMHGYDTGLFGPDRNITRAETAQVFYNLLTNKTVGAVRTGFNDISSSAWYYEAVSVLASRGIVDGYPDGSFRPENPITRAEFATIAARFDNLSSGGKQFSDVPQSHWAYSYINSASAKGWVNGYPDGTFKPDQNILRCEAATLINAVLDRSPDNAFIDGDNGVKLFPDVAKSHWAFYQIAEATNGHDYIRTDGGEEWTKLK